MWCRSPKYSLAWLLLPLLTLAGCDSPPMQTAWGPVIQVGTAEQQTAPALVTRADRVTLAWVGADDDGVHQDGRTILTGGRLSPRVVIPLPPVHPYDQTLLPATAEGVHLLWHDADPENDGKLTLFNAVLTDALTVFRGPTTLGEATCYDALRNNDGSLWVAWLGGSVAVPALHIGYVDPSGRARGESVVAQGAGCPVFAAGHILWTSPQNLLAVADFANGAPQTPRAVAPGPPLTSGDRVTAFYAGGDATHLYAFWNVVTADGTPQTWHTSAPVSVDAWPVPQILGVSTRDDEPFRTGFNGGDTLAASPGPTPMTHAYPLRTVETPLPVAAAVEGHLGVAYFRAGEIVGWGAVTPVNRLMRAPILSADGARHLHLAWTEPFPGDLAALNFTSTRLAYE